jgi:hypothetical protein
MIFRAALYYVAFCFFIGALISLVLLAAVVVGVLALDAVRSAAFRDLAVLVIRVLAIGVGTVLLWRRWEP